MIISPAQSRAARGLLGWSQSVLAEKAGVSRATVADFEREVRTPIANNLRAIKAVLEEAGVDFETRDDGSVSVTLKA